MDERLDYILSSICVSGTSDKILKTFIYLVEFKSNGWTTSLSINPETLIGIIGTVAATVDAFAWKLFVAQV
jgi:hypothetical protein